MIKDISEYVLLDQFNSDLWLGELFYIKTCQFGML